MKMYSLVLAVVLSLFSVPSFASDIYQKVFPAVQETDPEQIIIETYKEALKSKNALSTEIAKMKQNVEGAGDVGLPEKKDMLLSYFGKGSATEYGLTYLVGVPVTMQGTGNIRGLELYIRVRIILDYATSTTTVTLESLVDLKDRK